MIARVAARMCLVGHHGSAPRQAVVALVVLAFTAAIITGCGSSSSSANSSADKALGAAQIQAPAAIAAKQRIVVCSDEVEPPFAYHNGGELTGSEVEIMNAVGKAMGVKTEYSQIGFDGLFAALRAGKCDVAIDEVSDTIEREQAIADVDYMEVGQTFMVKSGNPLHLNAFTDLCGHAVGAVLASVDLEYLHTLSKQCTSKGKSAVTIEGFNDDPTGAIALISGKIDAFEEDTPLLTGLIARSGGAIVLSSQPQIKRIPCGIAVAHGNTALANAIRQALNKLYAAGTMQQIFTKFHEGGVALSGGEPVTIDAASTGG
jgi:polar amino acid transport system substrate-binding protein